MWSVLISLVQCFVRQQIHHYILPNFGSSCHLCLQYWASWTDRETGFFLAGIIISEMDEAWFRSPQVLVHSALHAALSGRLVWSVIKNKIILTINGTILAASLLSSQIFWVLCLKSLLKIMVFLMSLDKFQTHCTHFVHSRPRAASHWQHETD